jgi:hypothetical protein
MSAEYAVPGPDRMYAALSKAGRAPADSGHLDGEWERTTYRSIDRSQVVSIARGVQSACQADLPAPARDCTAPGFEQHGFYRGLTSIDSAAGGQPESRWALFVGIDVEPAWDEEFNDWYDTEHLPLLTGVQGVVRSRRYVRTAGSAGCRELARYVTVFDLTDPGAPESDNWHAGVSTPWCRRIFRVRRLMWRSVFERCGAG